MFTRILNLPLLLQQKSLLFLGARQTGKSTLLRNNFPGALYIDLLRADLFRDYSTRPELLRLEWPKKNPKVVIIDEVQRVPSLLNEIHGLIETHKNVRFILTGSSAKTLKSGGTNLLAGRAWPVYFHPLVTNEVSTKISEKEFLHLLQFGGLPAVYNSKNPALELKAYVGTYLAEEIRAQALIKNFERFSHFLETASFSNCEIINFTKVGSDAQVPPRTVREYFTLLEDTLIGKQLHPFSSKSTRKMITSSKFYFFDLGVANYLSERKIEGPKTESYGKALEHWIFHELSTYIDYNLLDVKLNYWHTQNHHEVDFIIDGKIAIEVKSANRINDHDLKSLRLLNQDIPKARKIIVANVARYYKEDEGIEIFPVFEFLKELWNKEFF